VHGAILARHPALPFIPGVPEGGDLEAARIVAWVEQAQTSLSALARLDIGDQMIGKILSKAPAAEDKVWPYLPVRDALELVANHHIERGMHVALRNARGAHWRGEPHRRGEPWRMAGGPSILS